MKGNIGQLMKQAQAMQENMQKMAGRGEDRREDERRDGGHGIAARPQASVLSCG